MPKNSRPPPIKNQLHAALPGKEHKRLLPYLESVSLPFMDVLYVSGEPIKQGGAFQSLLRRYTNALFTQVSKAAACVSAFLRSEFPILIAEKIWLQ
jgi:hypothetical protein